eukprot:6214293-Pleurochrysis_carterae.AAC.3
MERIGCIAPRTPAAPLPPAAFQVVFRGFQAGEKLQAMHDEAIQARRRQLPSTRSRIICHLASEAARRTAPSRYVSYGMERAPLSAEHTRSLEDDCRHVQPVDAMGASRVQASTRRAGYTPSQSSRPRQSQSLTALPLPPPTFLHPAASARARLAFQERTRLRLLEETQEQQQRAEDMKLEGERRRAKMQACAMMLPCGFVRVWWACLPMFALCNRASCVREQRNFAPTCVSDRE